jgi:hypothetical protein
MRCCLFVLKRVADAFVFIRPKVRTAHETGPNAVLRPQDRIKLFDRIIRSLTRNHHIVHVRLAQARAADAHEPRLLQ